MTIDVEGTPHRHRYETPVLLAGVAIVAFTLLTFFVMWIWGMI